MALVLALSPLQGRPDDQVLAFPPADGQEAWLVTYAPGEIYWQRFGHNAIWVRDADAGIDHTFNFGYFDFNQEDFLLNFAHGRMLYFALAQRAETEFGQYRAEDRTIRLQKLRLPAAGFERLRDYLVEQVQPETRDYLYDYYLENCSTRVRDALDLALDGALYRAVGRLPARQNFRDQTRRSAAPDFWYYLGLEVALGSPVDRTITRWDEMFMPSVVVEEIGSLVVGGSPVVEREWTLFEGSAPPPPAPVTLWWRYLLFSLAAVAAALVSGRLSGQRVARWLARTWLVVNALGGTVLLWLWLFTDHHVAAVNANLLLLNPVFALGLSARFKMFTAWLLGLGMLLAVGQAAWPGGQYTLDVLAFMLPFNLACAWWLLRKG